MTGSGVAQALIAEQDTGEEARPTITDTVAKGEARRRYWSLQRLYGVFGGLQVRVYPSFGESQVSSRRDFIAAFERLPHSLERRFPVEKRSTG